MQRHQRNANTVESAGERVERPPAEHGDLWPRNLSLGLWLIFLAVGGGILTLYYAEIGYIPDIEWSASIVYLAVATAVGGGVALFLALSVLVPGLI